MSLYNNIWPSPEEEGGSAQWKRYSLLVQCVFFFLSTIAIAASAVFFPGWFVMIGCIAVAELLILKAGLWRTGIESALWICGLYAFIFKLPHSGQPEAFLVLAAAAALAGFRLRNALFGTAATVLVMGYFVARELKWGAFLFAMAVAIVALVAQIRPWRRRSNQLLFQMLFLVMPVAGFAVNVFWEFWNTAAIFAVLAILSAIVGIQSRLRVPLVGSAINLTLAVIAAKLPLPLEVQLTAGGAIALAVAASLTRALRGRTAGFVLDIPQQSDLEALLIAGGQAIMPVHAAGGGAPQVTPQGGEFGGAGASGNF